MIKKKLLTIPIIFSLLASIVFADNLFESIFKPFFGWNIADTYAKAYPFIDFILYLFIFLYIIRYAISKRFEGATAKSLSTILAVVFAIGMATFERMFQFNLGKLAPLAGLILFAIVGFIVFQLFKAFGAKKGVSSAWAFLIFYGFLKATVSKYLEWLSRNIPFFDTIIAFAIVISIIGIIKGLFSLSPFRKSHAETAWDMTKKGAKGLGKGAVAAGKGIGKGVGVAGEKIRGYRENKREIKIDEMLGKIESEKQDLERKRREILENEEVQQKTEQEQLIIIRNHFSELNRLAGEMDDIEKQITKLRRDVIKGKTGFGEQITGLEQKYREYRESYQRYLSEVTNRLNELGRIVRQQEEQERIARQAALQEEEDIRQQRREVKKSAKGDKIEAQRVMEQIKEFKRQGRNEEAARLIKERKALLIKRAEERRLGKDEKGMAKLVAKEKELEEESKRLLEKQKEDINKLLDLLNYNNNTFNWIKEKESAGMVSKEDQARIDGYKKAINKNQKEMNDLIDDIYGKSKKKQKTHKKIKEILDKLKELGKFDQALYKDKLKEDLIIAEESGK